MARGSGMYPSLTQARPGLFAAAAAALAHGVGATAAAVDGPIGGANRAVALAPRPATAAEAERRVLDGLGPVRPASVHGGDSKSASRVNRRRSHLLIVSRCTE